MSGVAMICAVTGRFLKSYDLEANGGFGHVAWTTDPAEAHRFADVGAALTAWKACPKNHPVRASDGRPNRPLSTFTVTFQELS